MGTRVGSYARPCSDSPHVRGEWSYPAYHCPGSENLPEEIWYGLSGLSPANGYPVSERAGRRGLSRDIGGEAVRYGKKACERFEGGGE
nr:hypothetical protein Iba_chr02dCG11050 [Ipomoea batatas]